MDQRLSDVEALLQLKADRSIEILREFVGLGLRQRHGNECYTYHTLPTGW